MPECNGCGCFVTRQFVRVFGDNDGEVYACTDCAALSSIVGGAASTPT